jgi:hypothetical protein
MIRRDLPAGGRSPSAWILISQIEHAHLAGRLAEAWGATGFAPLVPRRELLWAIDHHDDGWHEWDQAPDVNPAGEPRQFTEMDHDVALPIWTDSIEQAASAGPLEGYLVAAHFCALGQRAAASKQDDPAWDNARAFLARYESRGSEWLAAWQAAEPERNTRQVAEQALRQLQFFDSFSLWFCCDEATTAETIETPGGSDFMITPRTASRLLLSPWPFTSGALEVAAGGQIVPARKYASREELAAVDSQPITLRWMLEPKVVAV